MLAIHTLFICNLTDQIIFLNYKQSIDSLLYYAEYIYLRNLLINKITMIDWLKRTATGNKSSISGNFKFFIKAEPDHIDTSSTVTVTAFTDKTQSALVPCHYRWFKVRSGIHEQIHKFKGSSYLCDPSDMGAVLRVQILSNDPEYSGKATLQFPPIRLALDLRKQLQNTLINGSALISGSIVYGDQQKQCQFKIFEDMIKICHIYSEANYSFDYSIYEPKLESYHRDPTKLEIIFGEKYEHEAKKFIKELFRKNGDLAQSHRSHMSNSMNKQFRVQVKFQSRFIKDLFVLTLKSFYTKRQIKNSVILHKIEHSYFKDDENFDYMFEIQSLKSDLSKLIQTNEKNQGDKTRFKGQVNRLQKQIEQIILTYTKIVQDKCKNQRDFNQSYSVLSNKKQQVLSKKFRNLETQNLGLNQRIKLLSAQIDQIRIDTSIANKNQTKFGESNVFTKKNMNGGGYQDTGFVRMLDNLSISHVRQVPDDFLNIKKKMDEIVEEKKHLEKNLEKSFQKIDLLEKQMRKQGSNQNHTAINFSYVGQNLDNSRMNYTLPFEDKQKMDKLQSQNSDLKKTNQKLKRQNKNLNAEISSTASKIIIKNDIPKFSVANHGNQNKLLKQNQSLKMQIEQLKKNYNLQIELKNKIIRQKMNAQRKLEEMKSEVSIYRRNQDVMNRSQNLSLQMNDYNQEQLRILKQHNEFLTTQNQKLSIACQKYMKQAKQNTKLRKQIIMLKQKLNFKILNPQNTILSINL